MRRSQILTIGIKSLQVNLVLTLVGARCSSVIRAFVHGAIDSLIDPSWWTH